MKRLFRPGALVLMSVVLALAAGVLVLWPFGQGTAGNRAIPQGVPAGDREIVWLYPATTAVGWERFVAAVRRLKIDCPYLGVNEILDANAFPSQTADVPELALTVGNHSARLWFRWYKLTADLGPGEWVEALARRQPPPLAIIGGGSSDRARELAEELNKRKEHFTAPPLLLITQASLEQGLMQIYPERSFRFCFTNRQMARAITDFIWKQEDLRPDSEPVYLAQWEDDPYSDDLANEFRQTLAPEGSIKEFEHARTVRKVARNWAWSAGLTLMGGSPPGLDLEGLRRGELPPTGPFCSMQIPYSVGDVNRPNHWEEGAAEKLMFGLDQNPGQKRPLLVLPASPQPARRFLRAVVREAPIEARLFVVATGDAIDFNTIYRDRNLNWPIQDLPVALVFFCHRNPVDPIAFQEDKGNELKPPDPAGQTSTGTQDLLLYRDIAETMVEATYAAAGPLQNADAVGEHLRAARLKNGASRFTPRGNQRSGTGEFVVCLRPCWRGDRVLPQARLQVWNRSTDAAGSGWVKVLVANQPELNVEYTTGKGEARLEN